MRRAFLLLLLLITTAQLGWAAAARYCVHESGQAKHFGHHVHVHKAAIDEDGKDTLKAAGADNDCVECHFGCSLAVPVNLPQVADEPPGAYRQAAVTRLAQGAPPLPERPNWPAAS